MLARLEKDPIIAVLVAPQKQIFARPGNASRTSGIPIGGGAANSSLSLWPQGIGTLFWLIGRLLIYGVAMYPFIRAALNGYTVNWARIGFVVAFGMVLDAVMFVLQYGLAHSLARLWFGARGTYAGILRAMLMGSIAMWAYVIPYVGPLVAGLWMIAILMRVFEEVDGIERMKAFGLSFAVGIAFFFVGLTLLAARR
jgi:hypothetical protein